MWSANQYQLITAIYQHKTVFSVDHPFTSSVTSTIHKHRTDDCRLMFPFLKFKHNTHFFFFKSSYSFLAWHDDWLFMSFTLNSTASVREQSMWSSTQDVPLISRYNIGSVRYCFVCHDYWTVDISDSVGLFLFSQVAKISTSS